MTCDPKCSCFYNFKRGIQSHLETSPGSAPSTPHLSLAEQVQEAEHHPRILGASRKTRRRSGAEKKGSWKSWHEDEAPQPVSSGGAISLSPRYKDHFWKAPPT